MSVLPLTNLCAQTIVSHPELLRASQEKKIPSEISEMLERQKIVSAWKWFVIDLKNKDPASEFVMSAKTYEDFCVLGHTPVKSSTYYHQLKDSDPFLKQNHDFRVLKNTLDCLRNDCQFELSRINIHRSHRHFSQEIHFKCKLRPSTPSEDPSSASIVTIAKIYLPYCCMPFVNVKINPLEKINKKLNVNWDREAYSRIRDFAIYYINQLAIDISTLEESRHNNSKTNIRVFFAQNILSQDKAMSYLVKNFEKLDQFI